MKISDFFSIEEFYSKDGKLPSTTQIGNIKELAKNLDFLRYYLDSPITINSGHRSISHNTSVGGKIDSQHLYGKAGDIVVKNYTPDEVYFAIETLINNGQMKQGGLGIYDTFVHYDIRGVEARWDERKKKVISTFSCPHCSRLLSVQLPLQFSKSN